MEQKERGKILMEIIDIEYDTNGKLVRVRVMDDDGIVYDCTEIKAVRRY